MRKRACGSRSTLLDFTGLLAVVSIAVYLVPEGAHFFEMFSKLRLTPNDYMTVQRIYDGWAFFGVAIVLALGCTLGHAIAIRRHQLPRSLSLASFALLAGTQMTFWTFIYPLNVLTRNWTEMPADLDIVRRQWEYAHAASAGLTFVALVLTLWSVASSFGARRPPIDGSAVETARSASGSQPSPALAVSVRRVDSWPSHLFRRLFGSR